MVILLVLYISVDRVMILKTRESKYHSTQMSTYVFSFGDESELLFRQNLRRSLLIVAFIFVHLDFVG